MKRTLLTKLILLLCALIVGSGSVWAKQGDILAQLSSTAGNGYATRLTKTDSYSIGWVLSGSSSGTWGSNSSQKANVKPTAADLPVVKGVTSSATTSTQYHYFYYTTTAVSNVGSVEFTFGNTYDTSTSCNVYLVMGDAKSASGGDAYTQVELSNSSTTKQGASISGAATYTFTFASTQTSAKYYGLVIKVANSAYKRFASASLTLKEGSTAPTTYTVTYSANGGSGTMTDSSSPYAAGAEVTLLSNTFTAPSGKQWNSWAVTDASSNDVSVSNGKFTMPSSNVTVTAQWADITHTLTYSATNGSIGGVVYNTSTAVATGASVAEGGKVTLTATPASGYTFSGWSVSGTGSTLSSTSDNPTTFTMGTADATVTATFALSDTREAAGIAYANAEESAVIAAGTSHKQTLTNPNSLEGVTYSSSNTDVATVASDGTVTLKKAGTVTITASFAGNEDYKPGSASYTLTITDKYVATLVFAYDAVSKNTADAAFTNGVLTDPDDIGLVYSSSKTDVATVNSSTGEVTIVAPGSATIKATINDDDYEATEFTYTLTVSKANTTLSLDKNEVEQDLKDGRTVTLTPTVEATRSGDSKVTVTSPTVTWTSSDETVATVSAGVVTGLKAGTATITASYAGDDNYNAASNATCSVTFTDTRTGVSISTFTADKTSIVIGNTQATTVTNDQAGWTAAYTYSSSNTSVATVDEDGVITAVAKGTATITATVNIALDETGYKAGATASKTLDITVTKPLHTATFWVNGDVTRTASVEEDQAITFPTAKDTPADATEFPKTSNGKTFVGWVTAAYSHATTAPSYVNTASATMSTSDVTYYAVYAEVTGSTDASWTETAIGSLTSSDIFVIVGNNGSTYALPSADASSAPSATSITIDDSGDSNKIDETKTTVADNLKWNISGNSTSGYTFYPNGSTSKYLYILNNNDGVRVGKPNANTTEEHALTITDGYLTAGFSTARYIGIYNSSNWRCYTTKTGTSNITGQTFAFYKYIAASTFYANYTTDTRPEPGIAYANASVDVKLTSGYTGQALTNTNSVTVTYSSSDETIATVNSSTGAITELLKAGSTTITATFAGNATYKPAEVSYTLNVTEKTPAGLAYATSEVAKVTTDDAFTNTLTNGNSLTVSYSSSATGVATVNSSTGEVTIKGAGETTITASFAGNDDYEAGNASYTLTVSKATPTLSFASDNAIGREGESFAGNALTNPASLTVTYSSSATDVATVISSTGAVTIVAAGTTTITASFAGNDTYASGSASYTLKVLATPTITVSDDEVAYGETFTYSAGASDTGGDITLTSGNTSIATVAGLVITPVASGEVEITVSRAETDTYKADSQTFTLTVTAPAGKTSAKVAIFEETFDKSTGGPLSDWGGSEANGTLTTDNDSWTTTSGSGAGGCAKIGTNGTAGSATTPSITVENGKTYKLSFKAAPWSTDASKTITVTVSGGTIDSKASATTESMTTKKWNNFDFNIVASSTSMTITFACSANRFFLDDVKVEEDIASTTVTLNKYGYATYCSQYPIDFSSTEGYTAWRVSSIEDGVISFAKITEKIKGGQGVLLYNKNADGENTSSATIKFADGTTEFNEEKNLLVGTTAPTYFVEDSFYGLSGNQFLKNNTCTLPAGKAYLPFDKVNTGSAEIRNFTFVFEDDVTGIETIQNVSDEVIFDLTGRRLNRLQKGVNIVNGKKILVK